jgi:CheY-like chemotaxis protein
MHGGEVEASSAGEGQGAELTVRVPIAAQARDGGQRSSGRSLTTPGVRVLIVEDNVDAAESLGELLEVEGHEVVAVAHSGAEGVEAARKHKPDVVLCDLGLPGIDGYGVARALRADQDMQVNSAFLVAISGYARSEDVAKAKGVGFDEHIPKPPSVERLEGLLARVHRRGGG